MEGHVHERFHQASETEQGQFRVEQCINDSTLWRLVHVFRERAERQHPLSDFPQDAIFVHLLKLLTVPESAKAGRVLQLDQYVLPDPVRHIII